MLPLSLRLLSFTRDVLLVRDEKYGGFILAPVWCGGVLMLGMRGDVTSSRNSMHSSVMVDGGWERGWAGLFIRRHSDYDSDFEVGAGETDGLWVMRKYRVNFQHAGGPHVALLLG